VRFFEGATGAPHVLCTVAQAVLREIQRLQAQNSISPASSRIEKIGVRVGKLVTEQVEQIHLDTA
jgi:hypothetical protein